MYCLNCGNKIEDGDNFCNVCGTPVTVESPKANNDVQIKSSENVTIKNDLINVSENKEKNPKVPVKIIIVVATIVILGIIISVLLLNKNNNGVVKGIINLNDYVEIESEGYDGYGEVTYNFDVNALEYACGEDLVLNKEFIKSNEDYQYLFGDIDEPVDFELIYDFFMSPSIDIDTNLSNGDIVTFDWNMDESINDLFNCIFEYESIEYEVNNLKKVDTFDAFDDISLVFSGADSDGIAEIMNENGSSLKYVIEPSKGLKNGDKVKISIIISDMDAYIKEHGCIPESFEYTYEVEGLDTYNISEEYLTEEFYNEIIAETEQIASERIQDACSNPLLCPELANLVDDIGFSWETSGKTYGINPIYIMVGNNNDKTKNVIYILYDVAYESYIEVAKNDSDVGKMIGKGNAFLLLTLSNSTVGKSGITLGEIVSIPFNYYYSDIFQEIEDANNFIEKDSADFVLIKRELTDTTNYIKSEENDNSAEIFADILVQFMSDSTKFLYGDFEELTYEDCKNIARFAIVDLNHDGRDELIVDSGLYTIFIPDTNWDKAMIGTFNKYDNETGTICLSRGDFYITDEYYILKDDKLELIDKYSCEELDEETGLVYQYMHNDKEISEKEYNSQSCFSWETFSPSWIELNTKNVEQLIKQ